MLVRPVVLYKGDLAASRHLFWKIYDVLYICAPESIDALRIVSHNGQVPVFFSQREYDLVLQGIRVLIFIHHNVFILCRYASHDGFAAFYHVQETRQQVVIIQQVS